ncbi:unnamed protein product [Pleuronectes platessa]|uniref:Uncharacterized protein n=1 Tax=Pleuronectes platessa TaxID=8262 RepID=A0A9N7U5I2_PLEPL|nr:unnamed protein product [Pleuronectes platessa]
MATGSRHSEGEAEKFSGASLVSGDMMTPPVPVGVGVQAGGQGRNVLPAGSGPPRCKALLRNEPEQPQKLNLPLQLASEPVETWDDGDLLRVNESPWTEETHPVPSPSGTSRVLRLLTPRQQRQKMCFNVTELLQGESGLSCPGVDPCWTSPQPPTLTQLAADVAALGCGALPQSPESTAVRAVAAVAKLPGAQRWHSASLRAIKTNQDLLPETPWINIFYDDFWGTLLTHSGSHKSYRPLCTLSFRLNHAVGGLEPWGYHLVNVALHGAVTGLFTALARLLLGGGLWSLLAGLLFASHPIHTEAVAGVVGRADEGAALFFLLSLLCYMRHCTLRGHAGPWRLVAWLLCSLACAACSMLWKELGVTVLAVSALYDVCVFHKLKLRQVIMLLYKDSGKLVRYLALGRAHTSAKAQQSP